LNLGEVAILYCGFHAAWRHRVERAGQFPGMLNQRTFNIIWVSENHGAGTSITEQQDAVVHYKGGAVSVSRP
jgi:hypothetical protein